VLVLTTGGATIARFDGSGSAVDATWDGSVLGGGGLPRADLLRWRIEAGAARPAAGAFDGTVGSGGTAGGPTATGSVASPVAAPAALGAGSAGRIVWRQLKAGTVRVSVTTLAGDEVAVLRAATPIAVGPQQLVWDGRRTPAATLLPSGHYRYVIRSQPTGATAVETASANIDLRRQVTAFQVSPAISPNGDGIADTAGFAFVRNEPGDAQLRLFHGGRLVRNIALLYDQAPGPFSYRWTGGRVADGNYTVQLLVPGNGGALAFSAPMRIDTHAPRFKVRSVRKINRLRDVIATVRLSEAATVIVRRGTRVLLRRVYPAGVVKIRISRRQIGTARRLNLIGRDGLGNASRAALRFTVPR
jgi:hypothetical protein